MIKTSKLVLGLASLFVASSSFALTLDTQYGKQEVPANPKRIVVFDLGAADTLIKLNAKSRVVGIPQSDIFPSYITNAYKGVPSAGSLGQPDFEAVANLQPDLIIVANRTMKHVEELQKIAPVLKGDIVYGKGLESILTNTKVLGKLVQNEALSNKLVAEIQAKADKIKKQANGKSALVVLANDRKLSAFGPNSRYSWIYEDLGFKPVDTTLDAGRHGAEISYEYVREKNPQYIFAVDRTAAISDVKDNLQETFKTPLLAQTDAVKNKRLVALDGKLWYLAFGGYTGTMTMLDEVEKGLKK